MKSEIILKSKMSKMLSLLTVVLGIVLLIYMIMVEDEPGALPLLLIVTGVVWFIISRNQIKKKVQQ
ncbi:hypothetical protein EFY79_10130 [Hanamia caeni]|jgi:hypothetical protein|uniref:Uncharacterized protein n=1 Tax=Hanamia caeni TaxID=2294116 RepID=A0A3M9NH85_9BACT|nr:hypothetical protein [Hanamia caeni]RNI36677.1 hypothetical protein EFY79_10130 [Hanamia caeni]